MNKLDYVASGDWGRHKRYPLLCALTDKRASIFGLGTMGKAIAKQIEPLGLDIDFTARSDPHHSGGTVETRDPMTQTVDDNLADHFAGEPLLPAVFAVS